jgi:hypothetical protein
MTGGTSGTDQDAHLLRCTSAAMTLHDLGAQKANPYPYLLGNWPIVVGKLRKQPTTTVRCRPTGLPNSTMKSP